MADHEDVLHSFVARLWLERGEDGDAVWRGHVRHVQNDREAYVGSLGEIRDFLEDITGVAGPALGTGPRDRPLGVSRGRKRND